MDTEQLLSDALTLMLLGMGTVFTFLTILVFVTAFMSIAVNRIAPLKTVALAPPATTSDPAAEQSLLAVITAAIHLHRSRR